MLPVTVPDAYSPSAERRSYTPARDVPETVRWSRSAIPPSAWQTNSVVPPAATEPAAVTDVVPLSIRPVPIMKSPF